MAPETHQIELAPGSLLHLDWQPPAQPGGRSAVFIPGLGSHRRGEKALHFAERFAAQGWGFLSLDLRGHGDSSGTLQSLTLSESLADLEAALDWLPAGSPPPVLVGSSMGGAVAAWFALRHPERCAAVVGIAPALKYPLHLLDRLDGPQRAAWEADGTHRLQSEWIDQPLGWQLITDGRRYPPEHLRRDLRTPLLILHGLRDGSVPWQDSLSFTEQCAEPRVGLHLIKDGDHRLTAHKALLFSLAWSWLEALLNPPAPDATPAGG